MRSCFLAPATAAPPPRGGTRLAARVWLGRALPLLMGLACAGTATAGELGRLIGEALRTYPSVQAQQARAGAAHAGVESARWQYWPTPYANVQTASAGANNPAYRGDNKVMALGLTQPLWNAGRLDARLDQARADEDAAVASQEQTRQQLALKVTQSYGDWWAAQLKLQAYEKGRRVHEQLLAQVGRRVEAGQAARSDEALAQGRLASLQADLAGAQVQSRVALARLSQLVGRPLDAVALAQRPEAPQPVRSELPALLDQAYAVSPALAQYRALARSQLAVVAQRKAERLPELQLRVEHQHGSFSTAGVSPGNVVSLALTSNFGAGLSSQSAIGEAVARHDAALADLEQQARDLGEQVMADHALLLQSKPRRQALRAAIELADAVRESWDRQYQAGRKTWQDLMSAAREQVQNEAQAADVEAAQLVASWRLALLTAGVDTTLSSQPTAPAREPQR